MNRSRVKAGNRFLCALVALALVLGGSARARADDGAAPNFWFAGTQLIFDDPEQHDGALAIGIGDAGLARFLAKAGATLAYQPKQKYIVVTAADHRTIAFAIGDASFSVGGDMQAAAFAPYVTGGVVYLPFLDLARALYVDPVDGGSETVLQPQLAALEVHTEGRVTTVTLRGAMPLSYKRLSDDDDDDVALAFSGTASTLEANRRI